jgi:hypothetical protein
VIVYAHMRHRAGTPAENAADNAALAPYYGRVAPYHASVPAAEIRHVYFDESHSIPRVMAKIIAAAGSPRSIWRLMVNCHGAPGEILLGSGITVHNAREFRALAPYMTPGGSGIMIGCCLAAAGGQVGRDTGQGCIRLESSEDNGLALLIQIARYSGARVEGGLDSQVTWELNGPILTVTPDGSIALRMGRTVPSIRPEERLSHPYRCD